MITQVSPVHTKACAPKLTAKLAPWMTELSKDFNKTAQWLDTYGSPLHVTVLSEFDKNIENLQKPLKDRGVQGNLFFARKANKLAWFVKRAIDNGIGIDTASLPEVEESLALGAPPQSIVVTAIGKNERLVERSIKEGCLLVIDNYDELQLIESFANKLNKTARVGIRFSGFQLENRIVFSRFGFPVKDALSLAEKVAGNNKLKLEVFHAHIDKYDPKERAAAVFEFIRVIDQLADKGINVNAIDIGGGILINYLAEEQEWLTYLDELKQAVLGKRESFNHDNDGLGFFKTDNQIQGEADLYPFWNNLAQERFIEALLDCRDYTGSTDNVLHQELSQRNISLSFEPGRALLDNTGITLAQVAFRKLDTMGNQLIGLEMNRMNLKPFRAEFCSDPIHMKDLRKSDGKRSSLNEGAFLVGCLCSESDYIFKRRLALTELPEAGDIFFFANTAGYMAHHMEIGSHGGNLPNNLLINSQSQNFEVISSSHE